MRRCIRIFLCCCLLPAASCAVAQTPDSGVGGALRGPASRAGVVFVGSVTGVTHRDGMVEVRFACQHAVLATAKTTAVSDANGKVQVTPATVPGVPQMIQITAVTRTSGAISTTVVKTP